MRRTSSRRAIASARCCWQWTRASRASPCRPPTWSSSRATCSTTRHVHIQNQGFRGSLAFRACRGQHSTTGLEPCTKRLLSSVKHDYPISEHVTAALFLPPAVRRTMGIVYVGADGSIKECSLLAGKCTRSAGLAPRCPLPCAWEDMLSGGEHSTSGSFRSGAQCPSSRAPDAWFLKM